MKTGVLGQSVVSFSVMQQDKYNDLGLKREKDKILDKLRTKLVMLMICCGFFSDNRDSVFTSTSNT